MATPAPGRRIGDQVTDLVDGASRVLVATPAPGRRIGDTVFMHCLHGGGHVATPAPGRRIGDA